MNAVSFVGLGAMGSGMARRLLEAGYAVTVFDTDATRMVALVGDGASQATGLTDVAAGGATVLMSLPTPAVAEAVADELLGHISAGQVVVDLGTMRPAHCRAIAARFSDAGAHFVDAPVTGGVDGARDGALRLFVAGEPDATTQAALACLGKVVRCGASGHGQALKLVNQMCMGLTNAVMLEALAYGSAEGLDADLMGGALGGNADWRSDFARLARCMSDDAAAHVGIKHGQLGYVLEEVAEHGPELPGTAAIYGYCQGMEETIREANRMSPSYWNALQRTGAKSPD